MFKIQPVLLIFLFSDSYVLRYTIHSHTENYKYIPSLNMQFEANCSCSTTSYMFNDTFVKKILSFLMPLTSIFFGTMATVDDHGLALSYTIFNSNIFFKCLFISARWIWCLIVQMKLSGNFLSLQIPLYSK